MKYKVSVIKKIAFLVMTMALAVAMVACQAATPKPGAQGDPGEQGPPGTADNASPMVVADNPLKNVYLALAGSGVAKMKMGIDLSKHFTDAESAVLDFSATSSDTNVATVKVEGDKLSVEGKKVGMATVTVSVHDNVNAPVEGTFDVIVVADNAKPTILGAALGETIPNGDTGAAKLAKKLYVLNGPQKVTVQSDIYAGLAVGVEDDVFFDTVVMGAKGAADDVVKVSVNKKPGTVDMWEVTLEPLKGGHQNVEVTVTDKFGAKANDKWSFQAVVNTVPTKVFDLPATMVIDQSDVVDGPTLGLADIDISRHFETAEKSPSGLSNTPSERSVAEVAAFTAEEATVVPTVAEAGAVAHNDSTCTYSTSPDQTIGDHVGSGPSVVADENNNGTNVVQVPTGKLGTFVLTIVCRDEEGSDHGTTEVTVRP